MRYIAFIRNVMVGRQGLDRETLISCFADAGARNPRSHLATGNVSFEADEREVAKLQESVECAIASVIGRSESVILRTQAQLVDLVAAEPFAEYAGQDLALEITFSDERNRGLDATRFAEVAGLQVVECREFELLTAQPRDARVRHPLPIVERLSGGRATTRALSTVIRLANA